MRYLLILGLLGAAFVGWKKYQGSQPPAPAPVAQPDKTPGAHMENRVNNLSGAAPME